MDRALSNDLAAGLSERESPLPLASPGKVRPADLGAITRWVRERFRASTWRVQVPGVHPGSGLTYDDLLDILEAQGRDFRAESTALNRFVLAELQIRFRELGRMPLVKEFNEAMGLAVLAWVVKRFEGKVRDVKIRRLTLAYAHEKKRAGYGDRPIGVRTGSLALRVAEFGQVKVRKS